MTMKTRIWFVKKLRENAVERKKYTETYAYAVENVEIFWVSVLLSWCLYFGAIALLILSIVFRETGLVITSSVIFIVYFALNYGLYDVVTKIVRKYEGGKEL